MQRYPAQRGSTSPYLWCHPLWCTSLSRAAEEGLLPCPAEPKVCDFHTPAVIQQDVGRLEVLQEHRSRSRKHVETAPVNNPPGITSSCCRSSVLLPSRKDKHCGLLVDVL
jgi:hypothetical protein